MIVLTTHKAAQISQLSRRGQLSKQWACHEFYFQAFGGAAYFMLAITATIPPHTACFSDTICFGVDSDK